MPKIRQVEVYSFEELSPKAKERAIEKWRQREHETFDNSLITEQFEQTLQEKGLPTDDIRWSLSSSQGDGVAFYGRFDLKEYLQKNKLSSRFTGLKKILDDIGAEVSKRGSSHYDHYNTMEIDLDYRGDLTARQKKSLEDLHEHLKEDVQNVSHQLEKEGYQEIDYLTSAEEAKNGIEANDYEFDINGNQI